MDSGIVIEPLLDRNIGLNYAQTMTPEEKVNYLVQNLRLTVGNLKDLSRWTNSPYLDTKWTPFKKNDYDVEQESFRGEGRSLTEMLIRMHSEKQGISFEKVDISSLSELIPQGNMTLKRNLQNNTHSFAIATIGEKRYIIDCAYRQFFQTADDNEKEETLDLETIMFCDEKRKKLAEQILKCGWIEVTPENLKVYLDGFIEATAEDKNVKLPTEQEYIDNIDGKTVSSTGKKICKYEIKELWKLYVERYSPNISDEIRDFKTKHHDVFIKIKNKLVFSPDTFLVIVSDGKKYLRTNSEDIEFTPENLKTYLDSILMRAGEGEEIVTPSIQEYQSLYPCGNPVRKSYKYIIESEPYILDTQSDDFSVEMSDEEKITSIVQKERRHLMKDYELTTDSLAGECEDSAFRVMMDSTSKGFEDATVLYPPRYLEKGSAGHNCTIINMNEKSYLIDCTYRQFFEERLSGLCGIYMLNDESRRGVAEQLLKNGWIEATPENIKAYMDGFEMGKRKSFEETGISAEEYIRRLKEHEEFPIHIVTPRQMIEAAIGMNIAVEDIEHAGYLIEKSNQRNEQTKLH
jgi:hypothetical protein